MDKADRICVHTEWTIVPGKVEEFKAIFQELLAVVKEKEPNTLRYECYFDKDQTKSYIVEEYPNTEAVRAHTLHVTLTLRKLLKISKITNATVLGELNPVAKEALSIFGAENFRYWNGLAH